MDRTRREVSAADRARFEALYRAHVDAVLRFALARVRAEQAKDTVAETFLVAWRRIDDVPDQPMPWLLGVARKVIATQSRSEARRLALGERLALVTNDDEVVGDAGEQATERHAVLSAFRELSEADREILRLMAWDGLSREQAAGALEVSRLAFAVRLHRARRRFIARLHAHDTGATTALAPRPAVKTTASAQPEFLQTKEAH